MNWKNLCSQIDPSCMKRHFGVSEYERIQQESTRMNSTDLYKEFGDGYTYKEFYALLKQHFYYDKYICHHGIEFIYYIKFKKPREHTKEFLDLQTIVKATGRI